MKSFLKQIEESFQSLDEKAAKPDFLDLDKDGDTQEPMKKAAKEKNEAVDQDKDGDNDFDDIKIARMMASGMSKEDALKKVREEKELEEISVTGGLDGGAGPPRTPYAFSKNKKEKKKMKYPGVAEAMDRKYEKLIEGYKQFSLGNGKSSPNQTVNRSIREVAKQLKSIEETIKHTSRLKTESGISNSGFTTGTKNALNKISERLIKISERVRSLGE
tara:strand:+ start:1654 stop:2304 length:651 start_codon:yes stop_codon:yes gene_type:complete